MLNQLHNKEV